MPSASDDDRYVPTEYEGKLEPNYYCRAWNGKRQKYCRKRAGAGTDHPGTGRCHHHKGRDITHGRRSSVQHARLAPLIAEYQALPKHELLDPTPELAAAKALLYDWIDRFEPLAEAHLAWHYSFSQRQRPIAADKVELLLDLLDEYEDCRTERGGKALEGAAAERLQQARDFVRFLGTAPEVEKPRKILDITTLAGLVDTISKVISRWHQAASINSIPRRRFLDLMVEIGRAMNEEVKDTGDLARLKKRISELRI